MKMQNDITRDVIDVPPPDQTGRSVVRFNGKIVERVTYSDLDGGSVTTDEGHILTSEQWSDYLVKQLRLGAWSVIN